MSRKKGSKNKVKGLNKVSKKPRKHKKVKCNGDIMANVNDVLVAITALDSAIDALIVNINNIKGADTQPAVDAINSVTAKVQAIQIPA